MKRARMKKEKEIAAQAAHSGERHDGEPQAVVEEPPHDSHEGEKNAYKPEWNFIIFFLNLIKCLVFLVLLGLSKF